MKQTALEEYSDKEHLEYLQKWLTDENLMKGWGMPPFWTDKVKEWVNEPNKIILMVKDKEKGHIVGFVNFYDWNRINGVASRGTLIDPNYQNKGYGKAAIIASNKYAFEKMNLNRIELYVDEENEISRKLTEKLGYTLDRHDTKKKRYYYYMTPD